MPKQEVANPMNIWGLAVVDGLMIVETIQCLCNSRGRIPVCQTQHGVDVGPLLWPRQLSPVSHVSQNNWKYG